MPLAQARQHLSPVPKSTPARVTSKQETAALAIHRELDFVLIGTAIAASIVSAKSAGRHLAAPYSPSAYVPADTAWTSGNAIIFGEFGLDEKTLRNIRAFYVEMADVRDRTTRLEAFASAQPETNVHESWLDLAQMWKDLAGTALVALAAMTPMAHLEDDTTYRRMRALRALLVEVQAGLSPCVDSEGRVQFPGWADRRQADRVAIDMPAELHLDGHTYPIRVADISQHGMGLRGFDHLRPGMTATVSLPSRRLLTGAVIWVGHAAAGVRFKVPLSATDPLLD